MATTLNARTIPLRPFEGVMNSRDPAGSGVFDPNNPGQIFFVTSAIEVDEDVGTAVIDVFRSGGTGAASVDYATQDGSAEQPVSYTQTSGTLSWSAGETGAKQINVPIVDLTGTAQGLLNFSIVLSNISGASFQQDEQGNNLTTAVVSIRDLDPPGSSPNVNVIWNGDFSPGHMLQWHTTTNVNQPNIKAPLYGWPAPWGDGSLMNLVTTPVRGSSPHSLRVRVKNSANGSEPADCDAGNCTNRRSQINGVNQRSIYQAMPQFQSRWITMSVYLPANWWMASPTSGFLVFAGIKGFSDAGSGMAQIHLDGPGNTWELWHRWSDTNNSKAEWQYGMFYNANYPVLNQSPLWNDGVQDFPNPAASYAALGSVNTGGWTDWAIHVNFDWRGSNAGGQGFLDFYKREGLSPWVHVLRIRPRMNTRGGITWDMGIGFNSTFQWTSGLGMYITKPRAWDAPTNREMFIANYRILDGSASLDAVSLSLTQPLGS